MSIRTMATSVLLLALPALANAQTWTSPDGFLSITPPDANKFQEIPTPPSPFVGLWVSNDESVKLGVMKTQIPSTIKLIQSSVEQGLAEEIGADVTRLPTREVSGHEVWNMTATGPSIEITQAIVRRDGTLYKVMAGTIGITTDNESVNRFISSLSIAEQTNPLPSRPSAAQSIQDAAGGIDVHNLSKTIGGAGGLLGIGLLVYLVMRGKKSQQL